MERRARLVVLSRGFAITAGVATLFAMPGAAHAARFLTQSEALTLAFGGARIERRSFVLTEPQSDAVERRAQVRLGSKIATAYLAWRGDTLAGTAFFESRHVRTLTGTFMIVVAPDTTVARVDVLAFHEPPDYRPPARWLGLFAKHRLNDRLWPDRGIRTLSGATLTTRAVTESVRGALALYEQLVAPAIAAPRSERE